MIMYNMDIGGLDMDKIIRIENRIVSVGKTSISHTLTSHQELVTMLISIAMMIVSLLLKLKVFLQTKQMVVVSIKLCTLFLRSS